MRRVFPLLIFLFTLPALHGQETIIGEWNMLEMSMENKDKKEVFSQETLKEDKVIWIMRFSSDGSFYQKTNFNNERRMDEMEGTWKIEKGDMLTIFLTVNGKRLPMHYYFKFKDESLLTLERYDAMRTMRMIVELEKS